MSADLRESLRIAGLRNTEQHEPSRVDGTVGNTSLAPMESWTTTNKKQVVDGSKLRAHAKALTSFRQKTLAPADHHRWLYPESPLKAGHRLGTKLCLCDHSLAGHSQQFA